MRTAMMMVIFAQNQPLSDAKRFLASEVLELIELRLDENLSSLEDDKSRLARKQVQIVKEFGSVQAFSEEALAMMNGKNVI